MEFSHLFEDNGGINNYANKDTKINAHKLFI